MAKTLVIAFDPAEVASGAGFATALGQPFDVLLITGNAANNAGAERTFLAGLDSVPPADSLTPSLVALARGYSHIVAVSSMRSKDIMARLAGALDAAMVTDAIAIESPTVYKRPIVAGAAIATVETLTEPVVVTFRPAGFPEPAQQGEATLEPITLELSQGSKRISESMHGGGRPDLTQARVVVSGGRPLKDAATFEKVIGGLADQLGGAVGATRAAVDSGIASNELQVGQTGKIVAPDLYIAAGISGSTQHMAGIKDSKTIVAINNDPSAPIFEFADLGLVADLYDAIPAIRAALDRGK